MLSLFVNSHEQRIEPTRSGNVTADDELLLHIRAKLDPHARLIARRFRRGNQYVCTIPSKPSLRTANSDKDSPSIDVKRNTGDESIRH
jgi:hypothetical protein